jgi:KaiC/GvpD/RAD55 family RecA-like ATPase|tara:strand:- start:782 stop:1105 length:324 start_codon:yes stop_codon:yes gene_type:complete
MSTKKKKNKPEHFITRWDGIRVPIYFESIDNSEMLDGVCYDPESTDRKIVVDKRLGKRRKLNVIIEEITHAFFYDQPEYKVRKYSAELGRVIYNRFIKQKAIETSAD